MTTQQDNRNTSGTDPATIGTGAGSAGSLPLFGGTPVRLTEDARGIGGQLRAHEEDFLVEEIPLYTPSGDGEHIYLMVEKRGLSTLQAAGILAEHFKVHRRAIGVAGLKDKRAITRQVFSVHTPGRSEGDFGQFEHPQMAVLWVDQHANKLRRGHLKGNRFSIRIRGVRMSDALYAQRIMTRLSRSGVPDRFGPQRFGFLGNNAEVGRAIILGDHAGAIRGMLSTNPAVPTRHDDARRAFESGELQAAYDGFPRTLTAERHVLRALIRGATPTEALRRSDKTTIEFYLSSIQSEVYNRVLDERVRSGALHDLYVGDIATVHGHRAHFAVTEEELTKPDTRARLDAIELSATGPMWSASMGRAAGDTDAREVAALEACGLTVADLERFAATKGPWALEGSRRPVRVPVIDAEVEGGIDDRGEYVRCAFELPRGAFATTVMDEIMKPDTKPNMAQDMDQDTGVSDAHLPRSAGSGDSASVPGTSEADT